MTIHYMNHDTIKFSSTNPRQVEHYEETLKDYTIDDIKENKILGRHHLLMNMAFAGRFDMFFEYIGVIEKRNKYVDDKSEKFKKRSNYRSIRDELKKQANEYIYKTTGWIL